MNAREVPEFCPKWWASGKPDDIKGQDLKKALTEAQQALANADKKGDEEAIDSCLATLKALGSTVDKTIKKECDKKKHKDLISVLEKFDGLIAKEAKRLEEIKASQDEGADKDGEDDEDSKGKLFEPDYLLKMIKLLKSGKELKFSFGLDKSSPENSCLLLCRKREPDRLFKMLRSKTEFSKRLMTYGYATSDGKLLQFRLSDNAKEPSQICKLAKVFLKKNPDLRFKKLRVVCSSGESFEEDFDADGTGAPQVAGGAADGNLQARLQKVAAAAQTWKQSRDNVVEQIAALQKKLETFDDADVKSIRDRLGSVLEKYPKLDFSSVVGAADKSAFDSALAQTRRGIAEWKSILAKDEALKTIDKNPFVNTNVAGTFNDALTRIEGELQTA
jgi:hypothetical protein